MAEIILTAVINKAIEIAGNLLVEETSGFHRLRDDIDWIERETRHIRCYLDDAEAKRSRNKAVANLINDIRDLAHEIEDLLDKYFPMAAASHKRKGLLSCIKSATCIFCHFHEAKNFSAEIERIKIRVEDIDRVRTTYGIIDRDGGGSEEDTWDPRQPFLYADESKVIGMEKDSDELERKLLDKDLEFRFVSIVGMPGLGKTTLAKKIYKRVQDHFTCSAMAFISQKPVVRDVLLDIAKQVGLEEEDQRENLSANLSLFLRDKRYVIFLDDIWNSTTWENLKLSIPTSSSNGSRIIITSRNNDVGRYIGGDNSLHELHPLDEDNSWKLFSEMIMTPKENINDPQALVDIGKRIVQRCSGIPLAIALTVGLLHEKERTEYAWNKVLESMGEDVQEKCIKILALSYKDLPRELKPCFLYFGLFPEGHEIFVFDLINIWAAEKFLRPTAKREVDDIGEDYVNNLVSRHLIQVVGRTSDGRIKSCRIHDLLHGLCVQMAKESKFFHTPGSADYTSVTKERRLGTYGSNINEYTFLRSKTSKLRALLCFNKDDMFQKKQIIGILCSFIFLRVLILESKRSLSVSDEIGNLSHLSYLRLRRFSGAIPSSIKNLTNLQTLDVRGCWHLRLPICIWNMKQLKHFLLDENIDFATSPCRLQIMDHLRQIKVSLPNLQSLNLIRGDCFNPQWLYNFGNLRKLGIRSPSDPILDLISGAQVISQKLENLRLDDLSRDTRTFRFDLSHYQSLLKLHLGIQIEKLPIPNKFPPNLTSLTLLGTRLKEDSMHTLKMLPKLKILKFKRESYTGRRMDCSGEDSFSYLEVLQIKEVYHLKELVAEDDGMPNLKKVTIFKCYELENISNRIRNIRTRCL